MGNGLDIGAIGDELKESGRHLELVVHLSAGESALGPELARLAEELAESSGGAVAVQKGDGSGVRATPALTLVADGRAPINYLALPGGPEAGPFAEILTGMARGTSGLPPQAEARLASLDRPEELTLFIASACPHCPQAVRAAGRVALASAQVTVSIVDAQLYADLAASYSVQSVPTTTVDGGLAITGVVSTDELVERVASRGTAEYEARVFESLVEGGRHQEAARRVVAGSGASHFLALWLRSATSQRIGLMLVVEEVVDQDASAMDPLVPDLVQMLGTDDVARRGDTADLLGQIGHADAIGPLEALADDPNPDVAEIAAEAIEQIRERGQE